MVTVRRRKYTQASENEKQSTTTQFIQVASQTHDVLHSRDPLPTELLSSTDWATQITHTKQRKVATTFVHVDTCRCSWGDWVRRRRRNGSKRNVDMSFPFYFAEEEVEEGLPGINRYVIENEITTQHCIFLHALAWSGSFIIQQVVHVCVETTSAAHVNVSRTSEYWNKSPALVCI